MSDDDDLPRGLPLPDAFLHWSDPAALDHLRRLPNEPPWHPPRAYPMREGSWISGRNEPWLPPRRSYAPPHDNALRLERKGVEAQLHWAFRAKLRSGELVAIGLEAPLKAASRRVVVARHLWAVLQLRYRTSSAEGGGLKIIQIEVIEAGVLAPSTGTADNAHVSPAQDSPAQIRLSDDDRVLTIGMDEIVFRGPIQQSILRQLVDAFQQSKRLRTADVLVRAGSNADTLKKAFRGSPSWGKLSSVLRQQNGYCWLEP